MLLSLLTATQVVSQGSPVPIVDQVVFDNPQPFSASTLQGRIRTVPNREALRIRGFTWWLWLYQLGTKSFPGGGVGRALQASGEPPAWLDTTIVANDVERLKGYYAQQGFRAASVDSHVEISSNGRRATVTFDIDPGPPTYIRKVAFEGLGTMDTESRRKLLTDSLLPPEGDHVLAYRAGETQFSEPLLLDERRRLLSFLRETGYASVTRDSINALVTVQSADSVDVVMQVHPGPRYRYGSIHIDVIPPIGEPQTPGITQTLQDSTVSYELFTGARVSSGLLKRSLRMIPGERYRESDLQMTKRRLESSGAFSFSDITAVLPQDSLLPHRITVRTRPRHQLGVQTFVLQSSGVLGGVGNEMGAGLGISYENINLFGGGEALRLGSTVSIAADVDSTVFSSSQAELTASLAVPYLVPPFRQLEEALGLYQARTRFTLSLLTARREDIGLLIQGRGVARMRLELQHSPTVVSSIDLLDLSLSNPDTLRGFKTRFLDRILGVDDSLIVSDPVQRAQVLEDYTHPQINNALRYTIRSERVNPLRRTQGYSYQAAIEVGGNLPYLLDRFVFSPSTVEGDIPGLPFFRNDAGQNRLNYGQYVRIVADLRRYLRLSRSSILGVKVVGGWAHPIGAADIVPFFQRFYSGGASSVRGWHLRQLGPGAARFQTNLSSGSEGTNILGGDIKLEFSAELKQTIFEHVMGAEWIGALFADAGNVWFGPRNPGFPNLPEGAPDGYFAFGRFLSEMGVGTGTGLRLSWEYLVARFDIAYRAWDPAIPNPEWWPTGLREPALYFRFGHAF